MTKKPIKTEKEYHTGIYLLPNLLTTASLFAAFYAIVSSLKGQYDVAATAIFIGMLADGFDGRIARLTNTQTAFGAQYDSLSDMVTFGVAPSLLLYSWSLQQLGKVGWLIAFVYTAAVALRLARFNTQAGVEDKRYFQGLACPAAAAVMISFVWLVHQYQLKNDAVVLLTAFLATLGSVLMVSNVRYHSFKEVDFKGKVPFLYLLIVVILFVAIAANPAIVLFTASVIYALSGPIQTIIMLYQLRRERKNKGD